MCPLLGIRRDFPGPVVPPERKRGSAVKKEGKGTYPPTRHPPESLVIASEWLRIDARRASAFHAGWLSGVKRRWIRKGCQE